MRLIPLALATAVLASTASLAGCNAKREGADDETRKQVEQLVATTKDLAAQARSAAESGKATAEHLRTVSSQIDALQKAMTGALASQKRGALSLTLDREATCDNDPECTATARAICNRINYPNALTAHFTSGLRPTLQSLVCFD